MLAHSKSIIKHHKYAKKISELPSSPGLLQHLYHLLLFHEALLVGRLLLVPLLVDILPRPQTMGRGLGVNPCFTVKTNTRGPQGARGDGEISFSVGDVTDVY